MPPKTKAKSKAEQASKLGVDARKKQQLSLESVESIPMAVEMASTSSGRVEDVASHLSETSDISATLSVPTSGGQGFQGQVEGTADAEEMLESIAPEVTRAETEGRVETEGAVETGADTDTAMATGPDDTLTTSESSQETLGRFVDEWLQVLGKDEIKSIAMFLCFHLVTLFSFTETKAAEYAATMLKKSDRTVRRWRSALIDNNGDTPECEHGKHQRSGVLWKNEELSKKATEYIWSNAAVKGRPNLTAADFCVWVNESLLPNSTLEPGFPCKICLETTRKWLHHLGFEVLSAKKGTFIDGHERDNVIESRKLFLRKMKKIGFLHFTNAPTEDTIKALPQDFDPPTNDRRSKTVVFFHDESTFMSNEDQSTQWGLKGEKMMKPKSKGAGIMVSDFVDEFNGFLALSNEEYQAAKATKCNILPYAWECLEYGESREGYWTRDKFIAQMNRAIEIAEIKYPKGNGWRQVWVFDHSSCHAAMADDALDVAKMNVKPGGKQPIMHDTIWNGKRWKLYTTVRDGTKIPKGMKMVLEERGVSTEGKKADWMRES